MKLRIALLAATVLAAPFAVHAQPIDGLYVGAGAGGNILQNLDAKSGPTRAVGKGTNLRFDAGPMVVGSVGYGLGNGLRFELQGAYYDNKLHGISTGGAFHASSAGGDEDKYGVFANALYDIPIDQLFGIESPVYPYVGGGVGYLHNDFRNVHISGPAGFIRSTGQNDNLAAQAIAGLSFPLTAIPGLALTAEYRFMSEIGGQSYKAQSFSNSGARGGKFSFASNDFNHSILLGVRYAFNAAPPPPPPAPVVPQVQAAPARTYLVFFDWDRADLTDRARQIIAEAAQASTHVQYTRIEVQGNADRSGTPAYNQRLSLRRAQTVAAELVRQGVPRTAIDIQAFGDTRPLVPTAPGVREPQNRRVAIILR